MPTTSSCCRGNARARRVEYELARNPSRTPLIGGDHADDDDKIARINDRVIDTRADNVHLPSQRFTVVALPLGEELPLYECGAPS
jgi:hypothetical protein